MFFFFLKKQFDRSNVCQIDSFQIIDSITPLAHVQECVQIFEFFCCFFNLSYWKLTVTTEKHFSCWH